MSRCDYNLWKARANSIDLGWYDVFDPTKPGMYIALIFRWGIGAQISST